MVCPRVSRNLSCLLWSQIPSPGLHHLLVSVYLFLLCLRYPVTHILNERQLSFNYLALRRFPLFNARLIIKLPFCLLFSQRSKAKCKLKNFLYQQGVKCTQYNLSKLKMGKAMRKKWYKPVEDDRTGKNLMVPRSRIIGDPDLPVFLLLPIGGQ